MIVGWMIHGLAGAACLCVAGAALDRLLRPHGRPLRWIWLAVLAAGALLPLGRRLSGALPDPVAAVVRGAPLVALDALQVGGGSDGLVLLPYADLALGIGWAAASALLAGLALRSALRLRRRRRSWSRGRVAEADVYVSHDEGPAVAGVLRPEIVVPRWLLDGDPKTLELVVRHEREHVRSGDPRLVALGALPLLLAPWNPALWWAFRRLREAVEVDCDRRVLAGRRASTRRYAKTLLRVGRRRSRGAALAAALTEPRSFLERRIDTMTSQRPKRPFARALVLGAAAVLAAAGACFAPDAEDVDGTPTEVQGTAELEADASGDLASEPTFTPYTERPRLVNPGQVAEAMGDRYPPELREAGIGGTVLVWFYVDMYGVVRNSVLRRSSGHEALDRAALEMAETFRFTPALNQDEPVPVWVAIPVTFEPTSDGGGEPAAE